ncbi:MAG: hypothetical protein MZV64_14790 [Ignavibacteriales bacterium]|nr:hypothetical protein [Ignavibacteriales bacterium]
MGGERTDEVSLDTADVEELTLATDAAVEIAGEDDLALAVAGGGDDEVVEDEQESVGSGPGLGSLRPKVLDEDERDLAVEAAAAGADEEEVVEEEPPPRPAPKPAPKPAAPAPKPAAPAAKPPLAAKRLWPRSPRHRSRRPRAPRRRGPPPGLPAAGRGGARSLRRSRGGRVLPPAGAPRGGAREAGEPRGVLPGPRWREVLAGRARAPLEGAAAPGDVREPPTLIAPAGIDDSFDIARDPRRRAGRRRHGGARPGRGRGLPVLGGGRLQPVQEGGRADRRQGRQRDPLRPGIAYREMGLLDAAVEEFETAAKEVLKKVVGVFVLTLAIRN